MHASLYNQEGKETGTIELPDKIFDVKWNAALMKQVVDAERANRRRPYAHTKTREEVRGGGRKPWRQKGTGRARHGSIRSPLWKGGGVTFGPRKEKIFSKKINKQMKRRALFAALSAKLRDGECVFVDRIALEAPKTKVFASALKNFPQLIGRSLAFISAGDKTLERASRNIARLAIYKADGLNALDLLQKTYLLIPKESVEVIKKTFLRS